jgi:nucleoside-diphosphate-sugar epimerase
VGLSRDEFRAIAARVEQIFHFGCSLDPRLGRREAQRRNVGGMREVLELAHAATDVSRVVVLSSARVSGDRAGTIREDELARGQKFLAPVEEMLALAERMVHAAAPKLPFVILRPGLETCLSQTGQAPLEAPLTWLVGLILQSRQQVPLLVSGRRQRKLHVTPVDFITEVAIRASERPEAVGKTLHLVDAKSPTVGDFVARVSERSGRRPPTAAVPKGVGRVLFNAAAFTPWARGPLFLSDLLERDFEYDAHDAAELLEGSTVQCAPFESYVDAYVEFVGQHRGVERAVSHAEAEPEEQR